MEGLDHAYGFAMNPRGQPPQAQAWDDLLRGAGYTGVAPVDGAGAGRLINQGPGAFQHATRIYRVLESAFLEYNYDEAVVQTAHQHASGLIATLDADVLASALMNQTNTGARRKLLRGAIDVIEPEAIAALLRAAGAACESPVSAPLEELIGKLCRESTSLPAGVREKADASFRALARQMIDSWSSAVMDLSATSYENFWEQEEPQAPRAIDPTPERIVQMALETGAVGLMLWSAVGELSKQERLRELLGMLKSAPEGSRAASMIAQQFATPQRLIMLLQEDPVDFDAVDALLRHLGSSAIEPMLETLISSHARATRRGILERLAKFGPAIGPLVEERLKKEERWFVVRNMLMLLREAGCSVANVSLTAYSTHVDPRVRREATNILFGDPIARDRALANAFRDTDPYMIRNALKACRAGLPDTAVPILAKRVLEADYPPEFRAPSIQLLGRSKSLLALDALLKVTEGGKSLLGKIRLAPKSPEMLAALRALARNWPNERRARVLLDLAAVSKDTQITAAIEPGQSTEPAKDSGDGLAE